MRWAALWEELYEATAGQPSIVILDEAWKPISLDSAQGLIQDAVYAGQRPTLESAWFKGKRAVRICLRPGTPVKLPDEAELAALVDQAFREARQSPSTSGAGWRVWFTPPLPKPWPTPDAVVVFAYATTIPMEFRNGRPVIAAADATLVSHPFAAVQLRANRDPEVFVLATSLQSAGMQGVRPVSAIEKGLVDRSSEVFAEILALSPPLSDVARAYYRHWLGVSGAIARCLPATQRPFLGDVDGRFA